MKWNHKTLHLVWLLALPNITQAYLGPGVGLSAIGSVIAFVGLILLFAVGFLWYPLKRLYKHLASKKNGDIGNPDASLDESSDRSRGL